MSVTCTECGFTLPIDTDLMVLDRLFAQVDRIGVVCRRCVYVSLIPRLLNTIDELEGTANG